MRDKSAEVAKDVRQLKVYQMIVILGLSEFQLLACQSEFIHFDACLSKYHNHKQVRIGPPRLYLPH